MEKFSYLKSSNADYIDELFERYQRDPESIDASWRYFFEGIELQEAEAHTLQGVANGSGLSSSSSTGSNINGAALQPSGAPKDSTSHTTEARVAELITAYRELGRLLANIDPLSAPIPAHPMLELSRFGLTQADLEKNFAAGHLLGMGPSSLSAILARLRKTYCGSIGVEFTHIQDSAERSWLQARMESTSNQEVLPPELQKRIFQRLCDSEIFERFLHTRYVAQKRFSIEGAESLIPSLDCVIETGAQLGAEEFVIGMAHRGRLNVLTNIFGKRPEYIFSEFEDAFKGDVSMGVGDVKYHKGFSADLTTSQGKKVHLSLASNPSHLEFVNPVIEGVTRAKQGQRKDEGRSKVIPIAIHGDAAFAGQGVCYETLNLSQLQGYATGGTIHVVINNQVGFTTSPEEGRSTSYSTDLAKMLEVPIFHVNGDDPEALWYVSKLCVEYRQKFKKDVFIDLICYRKYGHNEGDEPAFTQPLLYKKIKGHASTRELYGQRLVQTQVFDAAQSEEVVQKVTEKLTQAQAKVKSEVIGPFVSVFEGIWTKLRRPGEEDHFKPVDTGVDAKTLRGLAAKLNKFPAPFHLHSKLNRFFDARQKAMDEGVGIDWGNGETLAYASLLVEGHPVRLSGQDVQRGTFTHRHAVLSDSEDGNHWIPLNQLKEGQAYFDVHNSHLSETGVLGFEYGYSIAEPNALVIWEAQFGDFANGAQVIIDQFIASSESKWQRMTGITLLLPHGYEGQGPEHSSARLERFLQLCGQKNMIVCNITTPAQIFHALRRQVKRDFRKPLVVMSPKSLLRHPQAVSKIEDFSGSFREVLDDPKFSAAGDAAKAKRVVFCTGKLFYDLVAEREHKKAHHIAIVRVEQIYPWPEAMLADILNRYKNAREIFWAQEEPRNMGAWSFVFNTWSGGLDWFQKKVNDRAIQYVGRDVSASPAVGSHTAHVQEQESLIQRALE